MISEFCDLKIEHLKLSYEELIHAIETKKFDNINFHGIKMHKYYVYYNINKNNNIEISTIPKNFFNLTDIKIDLSNNQIYKIRAKIVDEYKRLINIKLIKK